VTLKDENGLVLHTSITAHGKVLASIMGGCMHGRMDKNYEELSMNGQVL